MRSVISYTAAILAAVASTAAQSVKGTAYGFATGVTGGGDATAAAPSSADELAEWLSDDTARVILIDQEYDFTGTTATDSGCDRNSCSYDNGGQLYIGDLSCGTSDNVAVSSITYDAAGVDALKVGSNKSIVSSNGKGVLRGKGLSLQSGASNVIIQGIEFVEFNPAYVWGGDALDFQGGNDGVWVDHCKFSLTGRMFVVNHYAASRITLSNNEFDGQTENSATCNGNHYWTMMFYGDGDQVTLDRNYFHDCSGRAPKLGEDGVGGTFQASNNLFSNMLGHAFDAYGSATALIEGNVFESVDQPITDQGASIETIYNVADASAASACSSELGRECVLNSLTDSGDWPSLSSTSAFSALSGVTEYLVTPIDASEVKSYVTANAGPANLASYTGISGSTSGGSNSTTLSSSSSSSQEEEEDTSPTGGQGTAATGSAAATGSVATGSGTQTSAAAGFFTGYPAWGPQGNGWGQAAKVNVASSSSSTLQPAATGTPGGCALKRRRSFRA